MKPCVLGLVAAVCLLACAASFADAPVVHTPTVEQGVFQLVAEVYAGPADGSYYYWCYSSQAEGTHFLRANADEMPVLNFDNPRWVEIDWDSWACELSWGSHGMPESPQERAWITDAIATGVMGDDWYMAYWYFCWPDDPTDLIAYSVLP